MFVPNSWFGVSNNVDWPVIQVALDGSYGVGPAERMFSYGGWFGYEDAWRALDPAWNRLNAAYGVSYFRSNELRGRSDWAEMREHFGATALRVGLHAVVAVPSESLLRAGTDAARKRMVFQHVVRQLFDKAPLNTNFAFVCDREQDLAREINGWIDSLKRPDEIAGRSSPYDRISAVCWLNSKRMIQVQAADLLANLARQQAEAIRSDPNVALWPLVEKLIPGFNVSYVSPEGFASDL
jgi:hypothetical protein